jgi:hypothetical protein
VAILVSVVLVMGAFVIGNGMLRLLRLQFASPAERSFLSLGLGLGIISYGLFGLGRLSLLSPVMGWVFLTALGGLIVIGVARIFRDHQLLSILHWMHCQNRWVWLVALLIGLLSALNLIAALAPPSHPDVLAYHLTAPKLYIQHRSISFSPVHDFANPMATEMLYMFGLLFGNDRMPGVLNWVLSLIVVGIAWIFARYILNTTTRAAWTATLLMSVLPITIYLSTISKSDMFCALYGALSAYAILRWRDTRHISLLMLSGAFAGWSAGAKYLGAVIIPVGILVLIMDCCLERPWSVAELVRRMLIYGGSALVVASPWYLQNLMATGNPFWPFLNNILGGRYQTLGSPPAGTYSSLSGIVRSWILGPWTVTMTMGWTGRPSGTAILPAFLAFVPVTIWFRDGYGKRFTYALVGVWCVAIYTLLKLISADDRFLYPLYPLLAAVSASAVFALWDTRKVAVRLLSVCAIAVPAIVAVAGSAYRIPAFAPVVLGQEPVSEFLAANTPLYRAFEYANHNLPLDARVAVFTKYVYYLNRPFVQAGPYSAIINYGAIRSANQWLNTLRREGATHILADWGRDDDEGIELLQACLAKDGMNLNRWLTGLTESGKIRVIFESDVTWPKSRTLGGEGPLVSSHALIYQIVP